MEDNRNVIDAFKGKTEDEIITELDKNGISLEVAVENLERDFNMGTIIRSANAFGVRHIHIIGRRQWNKRGAMMTDKYLHIHYYCDVYAFIAKNFDKKIVAVDNIQGSIPLQRIVFEKRTVLVFGSESNGISDELQSSADYIVSIEQFGSTRSMNVGVAAGIVMYEWSRQNPVSA